MNVVNLGTGKSIRYTAKEKKVSLPSSSVKLATSKLGSSNGDVSIKQMLGSNTSLSVLQKTIKRSPQTTVLSFMATEVSKKAVE